MTRWTRAKTTTKLMSKAFLLLQTGLSMDFNSLPGKAAFQGRAEVYQREELHFRSEREKKGGVLHGETSDLAATTAAAAAAAAAACTSAAAAVRECLEHHAQDIRSIVSAREREECSLSLTRNIVVAESSQLSQLRERGREGGRERERRREKDQQKLTLHQDGDTDVMHADSLSDMESEESVDLQIQRGAGAGAGAGAGDSTSVNLSAEDRELPLVNSPRSVHQALLQRGGGGGCGGKGETGARQEFASRLWSIVRCFSEGVDEDNAPRCRISSQRS